MSRSSTGPFRRAAACSVLLASLPTAMRAAPFDPVTDREDLPRVLLLGDSISIGYTEPVRELLRDRANVHRPAENCGPSVYALQRLERWLGPGRWDVIHFNFGLHDLKFVPPDAVPTANTPRAAVSEGRQMVALPDYEANLRSLVRRLQRTGARLVWCSTTPVPEGAAGRVRGHELRYNEVAARVMREEGIPIHDLHAFAQPRLAEIQKPADVHFTDEGSRLLAVQVAQAVSGLLPERVPAGPFEALPAQPDLPDPLRRLDGSAVAGPADWPARRREILGLFAHHMYGHLPPPPAAVSWTVDRTDPAYLDGRATRKLVTLRFGDAETAPIQLLLVSPNARRPAPVFLGLNFEGNHTVVPDPDIPLTPHWVTGDGDPAHPHRAAEADRGKYRERWPVAEIIDRGYAMATFYQGDIDPDRPDSSEGLQTRYYRPGQTEAGPAEWGTIAAWAWGLHRAVDYLENDPDLDPRRIAVMGHSRNGKTALVAAAYDERIALAVSNQSGCGGAALSRRRVGETVRAINERFPHWFCGNFKKFNDQEDRLPFDQHWLVSAIAPRPVLVCSAREDSWADPEGEFESVRGADPVYRLLGAAPFEAESLPPLDTLVGGTLGYHIRPGKHDVGSADWKIFLDFADRHGFAAGR